MQENLFPFRTIPRSCSVRDLKRRADWRSLPIEDPAVQLLMIKDEEELIRFYLEWQSGDVVPNSLLTLEDLRTKILERGYWQAARESHFWNPLLDVAATGAPSQDEGGRMEKLSDLRFWLREQEVAVRTSAARKLLSFEHGGVAEAMAGGEAVLEEETLYYVLDKNESFAETLVFSKEMPSSLVPLLSEWALGRICSGVKSKQGSGGGLLRPAANALSLLWQKGRFGSEADCQRLLKLLDPDELRASSQRIRNRDEPWGQALLLLGQHLNQVSTEVRGEYFRRTKENVVGLLALVDSGKANMEMKRAAAERALESNSLQLSLSSDPEALRDEGVRHHLSSSSIALVLTMLLKGAEGEELRTLFGRLCLVAPSVAATFLESRGPRITEELGRQDILPLFEADDSQVRLAMIRIAPWWEER